MNLEVIKKNWPLKLLALSIAIFLWFYIINDGYRVDYLDQEVQIEAFNLKQGVVLGKELGKVNIKVRAPIQSWNKISVKGINAYIDLKDLQPGTYEREVKVAVEDPTIQVVLKNPEKITVFLDELKTISREITVLTEGEVAEGYKISEPIFETKTVELKGAASTLNNVNRVVARVPLENSMSEVNRSVELEAIDGNDQKITNLVIFPKTLEVKIPVDVESSIKTVGIKVNLSGDVKPGYWISDVLLSKNTIAIQGNAEELSKIEFLETEALSVSGLETELKKTVGLKVPENTNIIEKEAIEVTVVVKSLKTSREIRKKPRFVNIGEEQKVTYEPQSVLIVVEGNPEDINSISENDIIFDLDLKGKKEGNYTLTLEKESFRMPSRVVLKEIKDKEIKLNLTK